MSATHDSQILTASDTEQSVIEEPVIMIEVRKLIKRFGIKNVLKGLDFRVEAGEFVVILGPNGAGRRPSCASWLHCRDRQ
jgi:ABC-type molybdenum transport system ATPase subunit/photorepair protein PhrA